MAIDINIFIENKNDEIQKCLAILEMAKDEQQTKYFLYKHNINKSLFNDSKIILSNLNLGKISFRTYNTINIDNYKKYL